MSLPAVKNEKGQYILYEEGKPIGATDVIIIDGCIVPVKWAPVIYKIKNDASKNGVKITLAVAIRIIEKQIASRWKNLIITEDMIKMKEADHDKYKAWVTDVVMHGSPSLFNPETGIPGFSKHQKGTAFDFNVTKLDSNRRKIGMLSSYKWLRKNAWKYGMVRTIKSEPWHFEVDRISGALTESSTFYFVPKEHPSWAGSL